MIPKVLLDETETSSKFLFSL